MGEIILVRHGQANTGAQTEEEYDRLSELGWQQARWLGAYFRAQEAPFDQVITGKLRRHCETQEAFALPKGAVQRDIRLNEMNYFDLAEELLAKTGTPMPTPETLNQHLRTTLLAWENRELQGAESFIAFIDRVADVIDAAAREGGRSLLVTSGGVIMVALRRALNLNHAQMIDMMLPIRNSSVHRFTVSGGAAQLQEYNAVPHLNQTDRAFGHTVL